MASSSHREAAAWNSVWISLNHTLQLVSSIRVWESPKSSCRLCLTDFARWTAHIREIREALALGWQSFATWLKCMVEQSKPPAPVKGKAHGSPQFCR